MAEEIKKTDPAAAGAGTGTSADDVVKNIKAEMDRKFDNMDKTSKAIMETLTKMQTAAAVPPKKKEPVVPELKNLWFDDPEKAAQLIREQATKDVLAMVNERDTVNNKKNQTIGELMRDFPELGDGEHDLTKKAVTIYDKMSDEDKKSPLAYKTAVREAAAELNIVPKKHRKEAKDDFSLGGNSGGGTRSSRGKKEELDPRTEEFAKLMGLNTDDEKTKKSLLEKSNRTNWTKYQ